MSRAAMSALSRELKGTFPDLVGARPDPYRQPWTPPPTAWIEVDEDREFVEFAYDEDETAPELIEAVRQFLASRAVGWFDEEYDAAWVREYFAPVSSLREKFDPRKNVEGVWVHVFNKKVPQSPEDWREFLSISGEISVSAWNPEGSRDYFTLRTGQSIAVLLEGTASLCWESDIWSLMADSGLRYPTRSHSDTSTHDECFLVPAQARPVGLLVSPDADPAFAARVVRVAEDQGIPAYRISIRSYVPRDEQEEADQNPSRKRSHRKARKSAKRKGLRHYPWMKLADALPFEALAQKRGAAKVARSYRGFFHAFKKAGGNPERMGRTHKDTPGRGSSYMWWERRNEFIGRHMAQVRKRGEKLWKPNGEPTNRHLGLIMWAYTPEPANVRKWLGSKKGRRNPEMAGPQMPDLLRWTHGARILLGEYGETNIPDYYHALYERLRAFAYLGLRDQAGLYRAATSGHPIMEGFVKMWPQHGPQIVCERGIDIHDPKNILPHVELVDPPRGHDVATARAEPMETYFSRMLRHPHYAKVAVWGGVVGILFTVPIRSNRKSQRQTYGFFVYRTPEGMKIAAAEWDTTIESSVSLWKSPSWSTREGRPQLVTESIQPIEQIRAITRLKRAREAKSNPFPRFRDVYRKGLSDDLDVVGDYLNFDWGGLDDPVPYVDAADRALSEWLAVIGPMSAVQQRRLFVSSDTVRRPWIDRRLNRLAMHADFSDFYAQSQLEAHPFVQGALPTEKEMRDLDRAYARTDRRLAIVRDRRSPDGFSVYPVSFEMYPHPHVSRQTHRLPPPRYTPFDEASGILQLRALMGTQQQIKKNPARDSKGRVVPEKYLRGLSGAERRRRIEEIETSRDSPGFRELPTDRVARKKGLVRTSSYTTEAKKRGIAHKKSFRDTARRALAYYKVKASDAQVRKVAGLLKQSFDRGLAAWKTGHRPGASQQAWGYARVASLLVGGKTTFTADADLMAKFPKKMQDGIKRKRVWKGKAKKNPVRSTSSWLAPRTAFY